jgi:hypothetical protein
MASRLSGKHRAFGLGIFALGFVFSGHACAAELSAHPITIAVRHGDCSAAVNLLNPNAMLNDKETAFLGGRMLDEGICVELNKVAAAHFFSRGANLGDPISMREYGAKVGEGEGSEQSYQRAGEICRSAGLDPQNRMSPYSLGYVCTVLSVAGRNLRMSLPTGAFVAKGAEALIEFNPATAKLTIRETPRVGRAEASTGSRVGPPLVDADNAIATAWQNAASQVPKPVMARLDDISIPLNVDLDMTLEKGLDAPRRTNADHSFRPFLEGDVLPTSGRH